MKQHHRLMAALITLMMVGVPTFAFAADQHDAPDIVFVNGRIYTVDDTRRWVEAIAVSGKSIIALGDGVAIHALAGPATEIIDLDGRMVMPGIHDAHTHLLMAGLKWTYECRLPPTAGRAGIIKALQQCAKKRPGNGWIVAGDYNPNLLGEGPIDKGFLDAAFPDRPIFLYEYTIHHALVNSRALNLAGIDAGTLDPPKGRIGRNPDTGAATGELIEMATSLVTRVIPHYAEAVYRDALRFAIARCHEFGITSIQEASATRRLLDLYGEFDRGDALNLSVTAHIVWGSEKWGDGTTASLDTLIENRATYATEHVNSNGVKVWMDGAPLPPYFSESRVDSTTREPEPENLLFDVETLAAKLREWRVAGIKPKIHVAGAGAARATLDAVEMAYGGLTISDAPLTDLAHSDIIEPSDIARYAELGVVAELSPAIWHLGDVEGFEIVNEWFPFSSLAQAGVHITMGSDWILPPDPNLFPALEGAVTRPKESISLEFAIDTMTRNGAKAVGRDAWSGSLERGKHANLIVLDRNLFAVAPTDVGETKVLMTVFEGQPVYVAPDTPTGWHSLIPTKASY